MFFFFTKTKGVGSSSFLGDHSREQLQSLNSCILGGQWLALQKSSAAILNEHLSKK